MTSSLDLNINNYTFTDLEKFFQLQNKKKYTYEDVELKEYQIREQLLRSGHIDKRFKQDLIEFLETAKRWIATVKFNRNSDNPTTIPKNAILDTYSNTPVPDNQPINRAGNIIPKRETTFIHTKSDEYFPGFLNPLDTRVLTKCLNIDSRFRDNLNNTQSSDFIIQLPNKIHKAVSMQLASIELPISFYGISAAYGNNQFIITVIENSNCHNGKISTKTIVVPDGNYNASDLIQQINTILQEGDDIFSLIEFSLDITQSGSGTGKVHINISSSCCQEAISEIQLNFTPQNNLPSIGLGYNLGFLNQNYTGLTNYISDTLIEPASIRYIYLAIDDYNNSVNNHFVSSSNLIDLKPHILARISIKGNYFSLVMENDFSIISEPRTYFGPSDIQKLRVTLLDEHGRVLQMNNANYSFCLNFKTIYDL